MEQWCAHRKIFGASYTKLCLLLCIIDLRSALADYSTALRNNPHNSLQFLVYANSGSWLNHAVDLYYFIGLLLYDSNTYIRIS